MLGKENHYLLPYLVRDKKYTLAPLYLSISLSTLHVTFPFEITLYFFLPPSLLYNHHVQYIPVPLSSTPPSFIDPFDLSMSSPFKR